MRSYYFAWWNVENLFDEEDAFELGRRTAKVQRTIKNDIAGWTAAMRDQKIAQLASVIAAMNNGSGPDLLGICEVENKFVVDQLVDSINDHLAAPRTYDVIHADTNDERGIDVAFIYDKTLFEVPEPHSGSVFFHVVVKRTATRDIVQVTFKTLTPEPQMFVVFGNHWPSRSAGQFESEPYREIAGETLAYFHQRALEVLGDTTPVIVGGDFNDEPHNRSLVSHALSTRRREKVTGAHEAPLLWNLMWPQAGIPDGSFYFDNEPNMLDQFLVNKNVAAQDARLSVEPSSVHIVRPDGSAQQGDSIKPRPFGGMGKTIDKDGFSDHFPIAMTLTLAE